MMPQVLLHVRMVFLAYTLMQLLMSESAGSMEQMQMDLRSLNCLILPKNPPQIVSQQENGTLIPVTLEALLMPLRTKIPKLKELNIPSLQEMMCSA
jgi:hypothetical protein